MQEGRHGVITDGGSGSYGSCALLGLRSVYRIPLSGGNIQTERDMGVQQGRYQDGNG